MFQSLSIGGSIDSSIDANLVLTDLDKNLRSPIIGEQCEAIVRFPTVIQRYPFPIFINSAALKLSEVFRNGSNFQRILIHQVMIDCENHLNKIMSIDEFVRNLFSVSYMNDPISRLITLRTLGSIAGVVPKNKSIHHFIRTSLDSKNEDEVHDAIETSVRYAVKSQEFAESVYPKIISMIENPKTLMITKIKLLEVINNIHHNYMIAEDARQKLISFLGKYPDKRFVCEDLHTLTSIAASAVTHISDQVRLLIEYYINDPRCIVRLSALKDLQFLACENAHHWGKDSIIQFVEIVVDNFTQNNAFFSQIILNSHAKKHRLLCEALNVLSQLLGSPSIFIDQSLLPNEHLSMIISFSIHIINQVAMQKSSKTDKVQILLVSKCFAILTNICLHSNQKDKEMSQILQKTTDAYDYFLMYKFNSKMKDRESRKALCSIFRCLVSLCHSKRNHNPRLIMQLTESVCSIFLEGSVGSWYPMICETIASLATLIVENESLVSTDITYLFKNDNKTKKPILNDPTGKITLTTYSIFFQINVGKPLTMDNINMLNCGLKHHNLWIYYKVAREAMRFSHHFFATTLLKKIRRNMEPIENSFFWINSLTRITEAESFLGPRRSWHNSALNCFEQMMTPEQEKELEEDLSGAIRTYTEGFTHLKATVSNSNPMRFQCEFIKLRMKYLQAHQHFRQCCKLLRSSPLPTSVRNIQSSSGFNQGDELSKCRIVSSMRKCAQEFRKIAMCYSALFQSSFNADLNSLTNIQLLQQCCFILAEVIDNLSNPFQERSNHRINSLFVPSQLDDSMRHQSSENDRNDIIEHRQLVDVCFMISELVRNNKLLNTIDPKKYGNNQSLLNAFTDQVKLSLCCSNRLLIASAPFPRFYFQSIQAISIKLELSPQPRSNAEFLIAYQSVHFVLNVEGVVNNKNSSSSTKKTPTNIHKFGNVFESVPCLPSLNMQTSTISKTNDKRVFRKASKILLVLNAVPMQSGSLNESILNSQPIITMQSIVVLTNDYFQTQFLLPFKHSGFFNITVEVSIIDENEAQWKTGPIQSIIVKVIEEHKVI
ncbi:hypothetical protein RDWZM_007546 [Blomia tropicalis]|uniref:Integrator complex subunit 7 n=1 Tax=Blomia tropicalis TaxID=40697 RepID=A0A9Q0LZN5_BLOTA|nr:hypothetical protein RDWZM_007546 [Blomia tropicalis]